MCNQIGFGIDIFFHRAVYVQMIRSNISNDCNVRRLPHGQQLEAGKFYDSHIIFADFFNNRQQSATNIAALVYTKASTGQKL